MSSVITTRNVVVKPSSSRKTWKVVVAVLGAGELIFFIGSCLKDEWEDVCNGMADCSGSAGTIVRVVDDSAWDAEATAEFTSSVAIVVKLIADRLNKFNPEPTTKTVVNIGAAVLAFTDLGCSVKGLMICIGKISS